MNDGYLTAVVCLNGQPLTHQKENYPERASKHCEECGAATIDSCRQCGSHIRGRWERSNVQFVGHIPPPNYCHDCGSAHPWTSAALAAAGELALGAENLSDPEKQQLADTIRHLAADSPKTKVAVPRFKKLAQRAGRGTWDALHDLLVDIVSESVRKAVWGK